MDRIKQILVNKITSSDENFPCILVDHDGFKVSNCIDLAADISPRDLFLSSEWALDLTTKIKSGKAYLVIRDLDNYNEQVQENFVSLLKDRRAGNYRLPDKVQIIIMVTDINKISRKIQDLCVVFK